MNDPTGPKLFLLLAIGLLSISFGSIFVRWAGEVPSLTIAFYRMFWAAVLLLPVYLLSRPSTASSILPQRTRWSLFWQMAAASALALHFATWVSSLRYTSVAVSVLLVNTSPIFVGAVSYFVFRERLSRLGLSGLLSAVGGSVLLFWNDLRQMGEWRGPGLALAGAAFLALYLVAGRQLRQSRSLLEYVYPTYLLAALFLFLLVGLSGTALSGFSLRTHLVLLLLALFPQCVGHTSYNWALRYLPATVVSTLVLAEPVLASLLAFWLLGEHIGVVTLAGGGLVALGIVLVSGWGVTRQRLGRS